MSILEFLGFSRGDDLEGRSSAETQAVREIAESLDRLEPEKARFVAAFAYILCRVAHADLDISEAETRHMEQVVCELGHLNAEQSILVVQMAKTHNLLFGGTQNYLVTREFNEIATREQKLALLECLFAVSSSDESISTVENSVIQQIADELKLDRRDVVRVRAEYKDHLEVLKKKP